MATPLLSRLAEIREGYRLRRSFQRELSACTTVDDLNDVKAAIARAEAEGETDATWEMRHILDAQRGAVTFLANARW